jgi:predicted glycogen debranching enzyme
MDDLVLKMPWSERDPAKYEPLLTREWLVTNGRGGYASGTVAGVATRRYHGLLIAALPNPLGRCMMLNHLMEQIRVPDGSTLYLGGEEFADGSLTLPGGQYLTEFRLESGLPVWRYEFHGFVLEKHVLLPHMQNTVYIRYRLLSGEGKIRLKVRPAIHFRSHDGPVNDVRPRPYTLTAIDNRLELSAPSNIPPLRMWLHGTRPSFTMEGKNLPEILYRDEASRGYHARGELWSPGHFRVDLGTDVSATIVASTETWETVFALSPDDALASECERRRRLLLSAEPAARSGLAGKLVLAADQFLIAPSGRVEDEARAHAAGDEVRTVIAGYHWFTDWGRDTMISLEGLTLVTGRAAEAKYVLRTFAYYIRDGLIPNLYPEGKKEGLYNTADATLWFFHAIARYVHYTGDRETLRMLIPRLQESVEHHLRGTCFGIHVDPRDGLLSQGAEGYQLTWMDAKVGDWVVTPRRGKAVEINALWYNALCLLEQWVREEHGDAAARPYAEHARRARASFQKRFWYAAGGYLYDVVDGEQGDDPACRPNQIFAISLPYPILEQERWRPVLEVVRQRLLTPVGLRSLAPGSPDYKPTYYGDIRARDAAYHQGTVWAWLMGPFVDAWLKVHPGAFRQARQFLQGFVPHLSEACIGSISEIFDAEAPYKPRGCIAQAWSVAEVLRAWVKTAEH